MLLLAERFHWQPSEINALNMVHRELIAQVVISKYRAEKEQSKG